MLTPAELTELTGLQAKPNPTAANTSRIAELLAQQAIASIKTYPTEKTREEYREWAKSNPSAAYTLNPSTMLMAGQKLTFAKPLTVDFGEFNGREYPFIRTVDGLEIALSQFNKRDYLNNFINPVFGQKGDDITMDLIEGKTITVQKTIANMPNFDRAKDGTAVRVQQLDRLYAPKSMNYFILAGVQEPLND